MRTRDQSRPVKYTRDNAIFGQSVYIKPVTSGPRTLNQSRERKDRGGEARRSRALRIPGAVYRYLRSRGKRPAVNPPGISSITKSCAEVDSLPGEASSRASSSARLGANNNEQSDAESVIRVAQRDKRGNREIIGFLYSGGADNIYLNRSSFI